MKCNKSCCHYPCSRKECGEDKNCKYYKSIIQEAIEFIEQVNKGEQYGDKSRRVCEIRKGRNF